MKTIVVHLSGEERSYEIVLATGGRQRLGGHLAQVLPGRRLWLVSDTLVARLYGQELVTRLQQQGFPANLLTVARGERSKSWPVAARLMQQLLAQGADRGSALIALGGGVVGDLAGFVAALFMRGIPVVQVPTTLLAMVDASIGGKTAINLPAGKNLVGAFHQPRLVLIDPEFLLTLPRRERLNGLAEVVKTGFIRDVGLLELLAGPAGRLLANRQLSDRDLLLEVIGRAAAMKAAVVSADEREGDLRRLLNFGHTLGHALEKVSHFRLKHGEAVAVGMAAALDLSVDLTGLPADQAREGKELLKSLGLPSQAPALPEDEVLQALLVDKKKQGRRLVFVLLRQLGEAVVYPEVPVEMVAAWLRQNSGR